MSDREPPSPIPRVLRACLRCRRQKLKCDDTRPCTMCARSGKRCEPFTPASRRARRKKEARYGDVPRVDRVPKHQTAPRTQSSPRLGASSSAVGFAVNIFGEHAAGHPNDISIPGHHSQGVETASTPEWSLQILSMPPHSVMWALVDAYFERVHWFIGVFHPPRFRETAHALLARTHWKEEHRGQVVAILLVAALGLQCAMQDPSWCGHAILNTCSLQASSLRDSLIAEVRLHMLNLLDGCSVETVQVCVLLGSYYIYHGSPSLAWNLCGLCGRAAYAGSLHCEDNSQPSDPVAAQVRRRTWNHVVVADTFAAMIYGRPSSLDAAFSSVQAMAELDDTRLPLSVSNCIQDPRVTGLTFYRLKYGLYEIMRTCLQRFRGLHLQNPISAAVFSQLVETIVEMRALLDDWKSQLPDIFNRTRHHSANDPLAKLLADDRLPPSESRAAKTLLLQTHMIQVTYESAVIFINRPLLEYRVSSKEDRAAVADLTPVVCLSMNLTVDAALRISAIPVELFQSHFCISFVLMHFFTAGVILCLPSSIWPFSERASEAKQGTSRIIRATRKLKSASQIARHTEELLTKLLKLSSEQEIEKGIRDDGGPEPVDDVAESSSTIQPGAETALHADTGHGHGHQQEVESQAQAPVPVGVSVGVGVCGENAHCGQHSHFEQRIAEQGPSSCLGSDPFGLALDDPIGSQMDEALGSFGQVLFNLVPGDPYSAWNWGSSFR
ncbi:uncharacterized protein BJX67DRAFT_391423 [Aspergillus lucknowensis]|uniref:Zn(2)-C6 fungal-type domain-containing protein n=1 Tax=Aspergillus lucknowensis TaxID=176173 RepID=A0ABR4M0B7_9EURO